MDEWNGVLSDLWDTASGVFDKFIDLESTKLQNDIYLEQYRGLREINRAQEPVGSTAYATGLGSGSIPWGTIALAAAGVGIAYLIVKD